MPGRIRPSLPALLPALMFAIFAPDVVGAELPELEKFLVQSLGAGTLSTSAVH